MLYARKFFKTEKAAKDVQRKNGGALYSGIQGSRTREDYHVEACIAELTEAQREERPFCVAWNIVEEGPVEDG